MQDVLTLYHGSKNIIEHPTYGVGNAKNDYGLAFYCTESEELAKEWACQEMADGFANAYRFDTEGLRILDLNNGEFHILNWLAILLENRTFRLNSDMLRQSAEYLKVNFLPDYADYDVIKGYRADDSYFSFANAFLNNAINLERLEKAMYLGLLGEQVAIKSEKAFQRMLFVTAKRVDRNRYYPKKMLRDEKARAEFAANRFSTGGIYMIDILREQWRNEDERLQRIVLR